MKLLKRLAIACSLMTGSPCLFAQNVGIGTNTPIYKLDVVGRSRVQAGTVNNVNTSAGIWFTDYRTNTDMVFTGMVDSVNYGMWGQKPGIGWQFFFDARYGNIGIGRKPASGSTRLVADHPDGAGISLYRNGSFSGGFQASDSTFEIFGARTGFCAPVPCTPTPGKDIVFWPPSNCTGIGCIDLTSPGNIGFYTNNPRARVHFAAGTGASGVLIGNSAAVGATGFMLSVDGKIICEELKVQLSGAWPDYVFENNYDLPPLNILEEKVMKEKHLPGIPSALEIENAKGVEVGAVQHKLLEKVEELYRYIFEMNRENQQLRKDLELLKAQVSIVNH